MKHRPVIDLEADLTVRGMVLGFSLQWPEDSPHTCRMALEDFRVRGANLLIRSFANCQADPTSATCPSIQFPHSALPDECHPIGPMVIEHHATSDARAGIGSDTGQRKTSSFPVDCS
jgi:hypothetical protein